jgi:hypothetical protein
MKVQVSIAWRVLLTAVERISAARSISSFVVNLPRPIRNAPSITSEGKLRACRTWEGVSTPDEQAEPVEM